MFVLDIIVPTVLTALVAYHCFEWDDEYSNSGFPIIRVASAFTAGVYSVLALLAFAIYHWVFIKELEVVDPRAPVRQNRYQKASEYPPPFPNGWFYICRSSDLKNGEVREVNILGRSMVMYRAYPTKDDDSKRTTNHYNKGLGVVYVLDSFCPHLGANLGVAGEVNKSSNCLKCCFHGWEFNGEGNCVKVEGTNVIPTNSSLKHKYPVSEANNAIMIWHDADEREPLFPPPIHEEINSGYMYESAGSLSYINSHIQEIPENGADVAHLNVLHKPFIGLEQFGIVSHLWTAAWAVDPEKPYRTLMTVTQCMMFGSKTLPLTHVNVSISQNGPGHVSLTFHTPLGRMILCQYVTPLTITEQMVIHKLYCAPTVPRPIGKMVLWGTHGQFSRDAPIWSSKRYLAKPILSKADGPILAFRRWFSQFYSPSSLTFADALAKQTMIDW